MATQQLTIPMFPLSMVLLPGETKTLHIFEERYKQLVNDCLLNDAHFGIPFINQKSMCNHGIEVKISNVIKNYENGEMDIAIEGIRAFKLIEFSQILPPKLYGAGVVQYEDDILDKPSHFLQEITKEYMWISQQQIIPIDAFDHSNVYGIARLLDLSPVEKYELLSAKDANAKEEFLKPKIKLFIHLIKTENDLKSKFVLN
ncbi:MAG TPA: LON peptidase substrate-binding domain-containing protein [Bacteroidia bacterium]|nr:LON peptidase substrate-binding domain-containing protein [Bacteroidia bacterium]